MIAVLLAVISVVGAWATWRHSPLYSTRSTLRFAVVIVLAIAAIISLVVAAVNLTINRSPVVLGATLAAVIVVSVLSLIFIIQAVATPPSAKLTVDLPATATLVHTHRKKVYKLAKFFAILLGGFSILAILIPGDAKYAVLAIGSIALLLAVVLLPVAYVTARNFDRSLTALELKPWAHWQYPPAQWKRWVEVQVDRLQATPPTFILKRDWRKLAWPCAIIAGGVFLFSPGSWLFQTLYVLLICGLLFALAESSTRDFKRGPARLRAKLLDAAPEVYFGHDGVFCDGAYITWLSLDVYLTSASIDEREPRSLLFCFDKIVPNPYAGNPVIPIRQSVLIPENAETDLASLRQELTARCPKARILLP